MRPRFPGPAILLPWSLTPALAYYTALKLRAMLHQGRLAALAHADVLVMPTMGSAAPQIAPPPIIDSKERSRRHRAGLTTSFSLSSAPALSRCCGFTAEHLPIGLQIGGKPCAEQTVLHVAYAYQQATDWHGRRPPL
jgi:aspartyl-tRNA(Asn)/glutamyl-tRNA(Gln) amidotransferase subunit A